MFAEIWTYIVALLSNWASLIWGTSLIVEVGGLMLRKKQYLAVSDWLDQYVVVEETRVMVLRTLLVVGLLIAGFNAWDEQYQLAISKSPETLSQTISGLKGEVVALESRQWPIIDVQKLADKFGSHSPILLYVDPADTGDCQDFADSVTAAEKIANWPLNQGGWITRSLVDGLWIYAIRRDSNAAEFIKGALKEQGLDAKIDYLDGVQVTTSQPLVQLRIGVKRTGVRK
jgi:hypothetical protein